MEHRVWKYELEPGINEIEMPLTAKPISVGWQNGVVMWVAIMGNPEKLNNQKRKFVWVGTGHVFPADKIVNHVGTVQDPVGLVWHIFEV